MDEKTATRIKVEIDDVDWQDETDHERQFDWFLQNVDRLVPVFKPLIAGWLANPDED